MSVDSPPQSVPRISANKCPCPRNWNLTFIGWMYIKRNNEMTQSNHKFKGKSVWNSFNPVAVNLTFNGRNRGSSFSFCFLLKKQTNKKKQLNILKWISRFQYCLIRAWYGKLRSVGHLFCNWSELKTLLTFIVLNSVHQLNEGVQKR